MARRLTRLLPFAVVAVPIVVFAPAAAGWMLLAPGDGYATHLTWSVLATRMWRGLVVPEWNPFAFSGVPFLANGQSGVFYPPNLLGLVLPPVIAYNVSIVSSFVVAGVGAWLFARRLLRDDVAATIAGLSFGLSGYLFARIGHQSVIATAAWLPWMLYGFELVRERITPKRVLVAAAPICLAVFAGHGQMLAIEIAVLAGYALLTWAGRRSAWAFAAVTVAGASLAAVQLVPTLALLPHSARTHVTYEFAMEYSIPVSHLWLLLFPYLFGNGAPLGRFAFPYAGEWNLTELAAYPGASAVVLALAGLVLLRRDRRLAALLAIGVVSVLLALGRDTGLSEVVYALPVFGRMRVWARYLVVANLAIAMLAAAGVVALREGRAARRLVVAGGLAVVVLAFVVPRLPAVRPHLPGGRAAFFALALPAGCAVAAAVAGVGLTRLRVLAPCALVAIVAGDLVGSFGLWCEWRKSPPPEYATDVLDGRPAPWGDVTDAAGGIDRYLFVGPDTGFVSLHFANVTSMAGWRSANGMDPLAPRNYLRAMDMGVSGAIHEPQRAWRALDLLRVTTILVDSRASVAPDPSIASGPTEVWHRQIRRYTHAPSKPDAWLERGGGSVSNVRWGLRDVVADVRADRDDLLVLSQAWAPGWTARVGDRSVPVTRFAGLVQAVAVPAGRHRVALEYRAPGLRPGALVSVGTLVVLLAWWLAQRRRDSAARRLEKHAPVPEPLA